MAPASRRSSIIGGSSNSTTSSSRTLWQSSGAPGEGSAQQWRSSCPAWPPRDPPLPAQRRPCSACPGEQHKNHSAHSQPCSYLILLELLSLHLLNHILISNTNLFVIRFLHDISSCCRYIKYSRWKPTSRQEAIHAEQNLLRLCRHENFPCSFAEPDVLPCRRPLLRMQRCSAQAGMLACRLCPPSAWLAGRR